jgi:ABC-2 type transport system ATP-binding protein
MECVEGLRRPDRGTISVLSLDPSRDGRALQKRVGVQLQQAQLQKRVTVWEAVDLWAALYPHHVDGDALLDRLGLKEKRNAWFMTLSGGQKQRLFIALALIHDPDLVMLDELTTGLDPQARRAIWDMVRGIRERGKTVLLTTHLMEEAERLCDRVAIIERGRVIDIGTSADLVRRHCPEQTVVLATGDATAAWRLQAIPGVDSVVREDGRLAVRSRDGDLVTDVIQCLAEHRIRVTEFRTSRANLEDVFLKLTGHSIRE